MRRGTLLILIDGLLLNNTYGVKAFMAVLIVVIEICHSFKKKKKICLPYAC